MRLITAVSALLSSAMYWFMYVFSYMLSRDCKAVVYDTVCRCLMCARILMVGQLRLPHDMKTTH